MDHFNQGQIGEWCTCWVPECKLCRRHQASRDNEGLSAERSREPTYCTLPLIGVHNTSSFIGANC
ncbi:hypothetical protein FRX31_004757 [Thalictrum thalictroides]|uniref:Uncharacterized protein n=1 Tax=Thalictrum thalictroides TaxID=46969 RepID=A0A7J6X7A1_THATH|nr:hypothetical protein FRX31_004757 [Thalictrum thalictroides]